MAESAPDLGLGQQVSRSALGVLFPSAGSQPPCRSQQPLRSRGAAGVAPAVQQAFREEEREEMVVSPWTLPSEIHRILHDRPESFLQVTAAPLCSCLCVCTCLFCLRQELTASVGVWFFIFFQPSDKFPTFSSAFPKISILLSYLDF